MGGLGPQDGQEEWTDILPMGCTVDKFTKNCNVNKDNIIGFNVNQSISEIELNRSRKYSMIYRKNYL